MAPHLETLWSPGQAWVLPMHCDMAMHGELDPARARHPRLHRTTVHSFASRLATGVAALFRALFCIGIITKMSHGAFNPDARGVDVHAHCVDVGVRMRTAAV